MEGRRRSREETMSGPDKYAIDMKYANQWHDLRLNILSAECEKLKARIKKMKNALEDIMEFEKIDFPCGEATTFAYRAARNALEKDKEEESCSGSDLE